ncbi:hypothetical protein D3C72_485850 [compost metagenome]
MASKSTGNLSNPIPTRLHAADLAEIERLVKEGHFTTVGDGLRELVRIGLANRGPLDSSHVASIFQRLAQRQADLADLLNEAASAFRRSSTFAISELTDTLTELDRDVDGLPSCRVVLVNTNRKEAGERDEKDMLAGSFAAVYYPKWQRTMEKRVKPGDIVALYASGEGLKGYGVAEAKPEPRYFKYDPDPNNKYETYVDLEEFRVLEPPVSAGDLKRITQVDIVFHQAVCLLGEKPSEALANYLKAL